MHFWRYTRQEYGWIDGTMQPLRRDFLPPDAAVLMHEAGIDACEIGRASCRERV